RNTLKGELAQVLVASLKTPDMREMAIESCRRRVGSEKISNPPAQKKRIFSWNDESYTKRSRINELTELYFYSCAALCEFDRGIDFYKENYEWGSDGPRNKEIQLYCL